MKKALLLIGVGIVLRLWFIHAFPQPFGWDQYEYHQYARKILEHGWLASHSYRSYPYPLFVAVIYRLFGFANLSAVRLVQVGMDTLTGILVYVAIAAISKKGKAAWLGFFLYEVNPFTAGYVGVILSEVLSAFLLSATLVAGIFWVHHKWWFWAFWVGLCASLVAQTRNAALLWAAIPIGATAFLAFRRRQWVSIGALIIGSIVPVLYPLYVNWRDYREVTITTVDSMFARELFNGAILTRLPPFTYVYPRQVQEMYGEYHSEYDPGRTTAGRAAMAAKYIAKARAIIQADPGAYVGNRFEKMWYVWQKENIFFYEEKDFVRHRPYTYVINLLLLIFAAAGLWLLSRKPSTSPRRWFLIVAVGSIIYATVSFSFTHAEYRLTIPYYPLLIMAAAVGVVWFIKETGRIIARHKDL
ncbi:hypothetical protein HY086_03785 [Candidatus Gottesmanbacteria bacterium]|nr:hypothetical protein [Candidatus Gottesmanbacteria bacterium]